MRCWRVHADCVSRWLLVQLAPKIIAFRERHEPPFIARVYRAGRVVNGPIPRALAGYGTWEALGPPTLLSLGQP